MIRLSPRLACLIASAALLAGCQGYKAGGPGMSIGQFTYESYPDDPKTVLLIDHTTGETLWSVDVPIGQKVVIKFDDGKNPGDPARPDIMRWDLMAMSVGYETLDNSMPVPPAWQRRLEMTLRTSPGATAPPP